MKSIPCSSLETCTRVTHGLCAPKLQDAPNHRATQCWKLETDNLYRFDQTASKMSIQMTLPDKSADLN
jgi:hypothetical protein